MGWIDRAQCQDGRLWSPGVERPDAMKILFDLSHAPDWRLVAGLLCSVEAIEEELRNMESVIEAVSLPELRSIREEHAWILGALHRAVSPGVQLDLELARQLVAFLSGWLHVHRETMCQLIGETCETGDSQSHDSSKRRILS